MKAFILMFVIIVVIVMAIAIFSDMNKGQEYDTQRISEPIQCTPIKKQEAPRLKARSYKKWEKKRRKKKAKLAMEQSSYIHLSLDAAEQLFVYDGSADEMRVLDHILRAKLNGVDTITLDKALYDKLKQEG